ncbi:mob1 family protein [Diplodia corticola]|uniref:Mob1 family protein n=1 Tax=Diplodia corticola TaxID=236234 RepID=A0A1J9RAX0_9PEZI|nr:mob1 family protein [Diplodia corticola]OJD29571.1 mob1 family protein [Diplodia corticola]
MAAMSPSSSPRLPSPPPIAEDQLGPKSPIAEEYAEDAKVDQGSARRIRPGTKAQDMAEGPPLADLKDIDSAFQLMEYLKALHYSATHPSDSNTSSPLDRTAAMKLAEPPPGVERALWLYELCRFLTEHANSILIALFADDPPCSAQTCPEMRASEWQYLCAVHDPPKSCCAVDYCCHTLDWAANTLTSPKNFPSRLALGTEANTAHQQIRQLTNVFRRVYRIFAHAWFQHRDMFWKVENKTGLYSFFKVVCDTYNLIPSDNYTIPPEAEGIESTPTESAQTVPKLLKKDDKGEANAGELDVAGNATLVTGNTTKRHRHTPSASGHQISVIEEKEEEDASSAKAAEKAAQTAAEELPKEVDASDKPAGAGDSSEDERTKGSDDASEASKEDEAPVVEVTKASPENESDDPLKEVESGETMLETKNEEKPEATEEGKDELEATEKEETKEEESKMPDETGEEPSEKNNEKADGDDVKPEPEKSTDERTEAETMKPGESSATDAEEAAKTVAD